MKERAAPHSRGSGQRRGLHGDPPAAPGPGTQREAGLQRAENANHRKALGCGQASGQRAERRLVAVRAWHHRRSVAPLLSRAGAGGAPGPAHVPPCGKGQDCLQARPGRGPSTWEVHPPRAVPWHHRAACLASALPDTAETDAGAEPRHRAGERGRENADTMPRSPQRDRRLPGSRSPAETPIQAAVWP